MTTPNLTSLCAATLFALGAAQHAAANTSLGFTPLDTSGVLNPVGVNEDTPFLLAPGWKQTVIADQLNTFSPAYTPGAIGGGARWGNWDMMTLNETGPDAGRYVIIPHEIDGQGVSRYDFQTNTMVNITTNHSVDTDPMGGHINTRLDAARWTPWGSVLVGNESTYGSMFEITNPLADPAVADASSVQRLDFGRVAFEGVSRAPDGNWYYGDENPNGGIYKYQPLAANVGTANELVGGQIFALKIDNANANAVSGNAEGTGTWVELNEADGSLAAGVSTDPRVNSRAAAAEVGATFWNRPEDSILTTLDSGNLAYLITITGTDSVITVEFDQNGTDVHVKDFMNTSVTDLATDTAVGAGLANPDNIALGPDGGVLIVEDGEPNGGDIWAALDLNNDGDVFDLGEGIGRFASLLTAGSEPSGLIWDEYRDQWLINVMHPASGNGMMLGLQAVPVPAAAWLFGSAALGLAGVARRKKA